MNWDSFREKPIDFMETLGKAHGEKWGEGFFSSPVEYEGEFGKDIVGVAKGDVSIRDVKERFGGEGSTSFLGIKMTPKQRHLMQAIVLLGEMDRANPWGILGDQKTGKKSWLGAERTTNDISPAARLIRAAIGARIYKREKGAKRMYEGANLAYSITELSNLLKRSRVATNPELVEHVLEQIQQAMGQEGGTEYKERLGL